MNIEQPSANNLEPAQRELLTLQNKVRQLEIALEAQQAENMRLSSMLENFRLSKKETLQENLQNYLLQLFQQAATPATQLYTQAYLFEIQKKPIQVRDVLAVTRRLLHTLEQNGMQFIGLPGEEAAYDPDRHLLLAAGTDLQPGMPVILRFAGVSFHNNLLIRAGVDSAQERE